MIHSGHANGDTQVQTHRHVGQHSIYGIQKYLVVLTIARGEILKDRATLMECKTYIEALTEAKAARKRDSLYDGGRWTQYAIIVPVYEDGCVGVGF